MGNGLAAGARVVSRGRSSPSGVASGPCHRDARRATVRAVRSVLGSTVAVLDLVSASVYGRPDRVIRLRSSVECVVWARGGCARTSSQVPRSVSHGKLSSGGGARGRGRTRGNSTRAPAVGRRRRTVPVASRATWSRLPAGSRLARAACPTLRAAGGAPERRETPPPERTERSACGLAREAEPQPGSRTDEAKREGKPSRGGEAQARVRPTRLTTQSVRWQYAPAPSPTP